MMLSVEIIQQFRDCAVTRAYHTVNIEKEGHASSKTSESSGRVPLLQLLLKPNLFVFHFLKDLLLSVLYPSTMT